MYICSGGPGVVLDPKLQSFCIALLSFRAREGGWGWVVLAVAFVSQMTAGLPMANGIINKHILTSFNGTSTVAAGIYLDKSLL